MHIKVNKKNEQVLKFRKLNIEILILYMDTLRGRSNSGYTHTNYPKMAKS